MLPTILAAETEYATLAMLALGTMPTTLAPVTEVN